MATYTMCDMEPVTIDNGSENGLETLRSLAKMPLVDIAFDDLTYAVSDTSGQEKRTILKGLSGKFRSGELAAILGPSGAGKSTLLNILTGYMSSSVTGTVTTNGRLRDMNQFRKMSCYIMQEDLLQPQLTVQESMEIAANLKLGAELGDAEKKTVVSEILATIGLTTCKNTRMEDLSGGQRKRLSVALELVNNPPVMFLDEPTSGLDIVAIKQIIHLLKDLARQGRTIICTIHQPSATLFQLFDHVYVVARGQCVYQGSAPLIVPFMSSLGLNCPLSHNPADYILETMQNDIDNLTVMSSAIQNGKISKRQSVINCYTKMDDQNNSVSTDLRPEMDNEISVRDMSSTFGAQFTILLSRMFLQMARNTTALWTQLGYHIMAGVITGGMFYGVGNDAYTTIINFKCCLSVLVFFVYTHIMIPVLLFPYELKLLRREYFNRWYGLKAYYLAKTVSTIPKMIILGTIYVVISYVMSDQPLDLYRFSIFCFIGLMTGICSEGLGIALGAVFSVRNGSIIGIVAVSPLLVISFYGLGYGLAIEPIMKFIMKFSYIRYALVGLTLSVYSDRGHLQCDYTKHLYCHYKDPDIFIRDVGMQDSYMILQLLGLLGFTIFYRIVAFMALRYQLTLEFSSRILIYTRKILNKKR